jgi:hypothetical protein
MIYRQYLILMLGIFSSFLAHAKLGEYVGQVLKVCPDSPPLLIKKSAVELAQKTHCEHKFTSDLLKKCSKLSCEQLVENYNKHMKNRSGSVVGE